MKHSEGQYIGEVVMDTISLVEEHAPGCELVSVQVTLVVREPNGTVRTGSLVREVGYESA